MTTAAETLFKLRRLLLAFLILAFAGVGIDLFALAHYEDAWQVVPLGVIGLTILAMVWHALSRRHASVQAVRVMMLITILTGPLGFFLHYNSNLEFQVEMDATQKGWALLTKVLRAHAPPALAPMSMAVLGLLGLIYSLKYEENSNEIY